MKYLYAICFAFISFLYNSANAETYYVNTPVLNLRSCPSTKCEIIGKLNSGENINVEYHQSEWAKVKTDKGNGFVLKKSIVKQSHSENTDFGFIFVTLLAILAIAYISYIKYKNDKIRRQEELDLLNTVTTIHRGTTSERRLILALLKYGLRPNTIFHDLYVYKHDGTTSQIDVVVATCVGIIVFEVKDYSGWIYGNGKQPKWTKVLSYGREKYYFYNPILQNKSHISQLQSLLNEKVPFYSVIVFYGDCKLQDISFIPKNTFVTKYYRVIDVVENILQNNPVANYIDKHNVVNALKKAVDNGSNYIIGKKHVENIKDMLGSDRIFK